MPAGKTIEGFEKGALRHSASALFAKRGAVRRRSKPQQNPLEGLVYHKQRRVLINRPAAILNPTKTLLAAIVDACIRWLPAAVNIGFIHAALRAYGGSHDSLYYKPPKARSITLSGLSWLRRHRDNQSPQRGYSKPSILIEGNEACALAAIHAGCRFFAGYPITPSTEIAEYLSRELPKVNGTFVQMEDEIASMAAIIGASRAGALAMTATSGPGFSLMQENLGLAVMTETPCVLVDVMRAGPSTGLPTIPMQGDVMQARWGRHGDSMVPVLCPNSVEEMYELTIRAFEISEKYESPTILLSDGFIGHMWESVKTRPPSQVRKKTECFGQGKKLSFTGLMHDSKGFPSSDMGNYGKLLKRLHSKFSGLKSDVEVINPDAEKFLVSFGCTARSVEEAAKRWGYGLVRPRILFPFPEKEIADALSGAKKVMVVEMNLGQVHELVRPIRPDAALFSCVEMPSPSGIHAKMEAI